MVLRRSVEGILMVEEMLVVRFVRISMIKGLISMSLIACRLFLLFLRPNLLFLILAELHLSLSEAHVAGMNLFFFGSLSEGGFDGRIV